MKTEATTRLIRETVQTIVPSSDPHLGIEEVLEAVIRIYRDLAIDPEVWESMSIRTLRYYRQENILSAPYGRTSKARYGRRHVLEAAVARLAGHLHQVTLDTAKGLPDLSEDHLIERLAEMYELERRGRAHVVRAEPVRAVRPLQDARHPEASVRDLVAIDVGHGATLLLPRHHPALNGNRRVAEVRDIVARSLQ